MHIAVTVVSFQWNKYFVVAVVINMNIERIIVAELPQEEFSSIT